jgi:hypothetical protein
MDALERLSQVATGLLGQVDQALLAHGAPAGHPVWSLLREVGALPGEAVAELVELRADDWLDLTAALAAERDRHQQVLDTLHRPVRWEGLAGSAAAARSATLIRAAEEATDRLVRTGRGLDELLQWLAETRDGVARALAQVMSSIDAVQLVTGTNGAAPESSELPDPAATARSAAEIAATMLGALADGWRAAQQLAQRQAAVFGELAEPLDLRAAERDFTPGPTALHLDL